MTCPKSCRIYIARAGILIQISIVTTDTISKSEIVNAQAMYRAIPSDMRYNIVFSYFKKENKEMSEKRCYTVQELQEILGVSRSTIYNRC